MIYCFEGSTADEAWETAVTAVLEKGVEQPSRGGSTLELTHVGLQISDPRQRWVSRRREALNVAFAIAEVIWILGGREDSAFLNYFNRQLPKYAGSGPSYYGAYGNRLRRRFDVDQLKDAALALRSNPSSRQIVLSIWDPRSDLPHSDGVPRAADVPCNLVSMLKVRNGLLDWTQIMRSNDGYRGLPHNFVQFTMLQEVLAGWAGLGLGTYTHWSDSLHLYNRDHAVDPRKKSGPPLPPNDDNLAISLPLFNEIWPTIETVANAVTDDAKTPSQILKMLDKIDFPKAWANALRILVAEGLRRRKEDPTPAILDLSNHTFSALWKNWTERLSM